MQQVITYYRSLSPRQQSGVWKMALGVVALIALTGWHFFGASSVTSQNDPTLATVDYPYGAPTNYIAFGTMEYPDAPRGISSATLLLENGTRLELAFDEVSVCATSNGATPCMGMSIAAPFGGQRMVLEGIQRNSEILVRKLTLSNAVYLPEPGAVYIAWPLAVSLIQECEAKSISQSRSLNVTLTLESGDRVVGVEPSIDLVVYMARQAKAACGTIPVSTE